MNVTMSKSIFLLFLAIFILTQQFIEASSVESNENSVQQSTRVSVDLRLDVNDEYISDDLRNALVNATTSKDPWLNQYSIEMGTLRMRAAVAALYSKITKVKLDPEQHVVITIGAHEALSSVFNAITNPGDEWIVFEPFWSKYPTMITIARGVPRYTNLKQTKFSKTLNGNDWELDREEFESLFNNRTRGILFNNPNNPSGKVYTKKDLDFIASVVKKYNVVIISDEVHEFAVYKPYRHINIASLPGMFNHTVTIGSASKALSASGWRVGWAYGPTHIMDKMKRIHSYTVHSAPTPQQDAVAYVLEKELKNLGKKTSYFMRTNRQSIVKRNNIVRALKKSGMIPVTPNGGFCLMVEIPKYKDSADSVSMSNFVNETVGVLGYPMDGYYGNEHKHLGQNSVRYCFQKSDDTLQKAANRLVDYSNGL